ncbi:MAG: hypothetical protein ABW162_13290 [Candidatus Sedimenticola sp. PURPLELP]
MDSMVLYALFIVVALAVYLFILKPLINRQREKRRKREKIELEVESDFVRNLKKHVDHH